MAAGSVKAFPLDGKVLIGTADPRIAEQTALRGVFDD
jgi:hypothetical protein